MSLKNEIIYDILINRIGGMAMKVLIASDIHGSFYYAKELAAAIKKEKPDKIVLLGDLYYHGVRNPLPKDYAPKKVANLLNTFKSKLEVVKGNCDSEVDEMVSEFPFYSSITMNFAGKRIFFTHGHHYDMKRLPNKKIDIMIYGHVHTGWIKEQNEIIFANPGSVSLPKQESERSYLVLTEKSLMLKSLEGRVLQTKFL